MKFSKNTDVNTEGKAERDRRDTGVDLWTMSYVCAHTPRGQMRRRKEPVNYALFLCFSIPGQVRGKIGKAEREKALLKEGTPG